MTTTGTNSTEWVHNRPDGFQTLITAWLNPSTGLIEAMEMATRPDSWATWGPPTRFEKVDY